MSALPRIALPAVVLLLAGPAAAQEVVYTKLAPYNGVKTCNAPTNGNCPVTITVGANCAIKADPETLRIPRKGTVNIFFEVGGGWAFDPGKGIAFYAPAGQISCAPAGPRFKCQDMADKAGYYGYEINVTKGAQSCRVDPGVWNDFPEGSPAPG